ncbi:uncharacterized protein LOC112466738 [Temnothorax curvispinosus]|uniref:Uncharacterized protein LOC112466738 n=1 Tax=Temnothorax curvispinosus TaxID=300111 RepID=A0A6J1R975_9HYME|nr:uncharacterized protein LOC112466738 [Temnothorax curvispinosus]
MFLLKCDEDESYCMVTDEDVIFDDETVKKGETVRFYYNKKQYTGTVLMFSDNQDAIEKELKRYKTECKMKRNSNKSKHARKGFDVKKPCNDKLVGKMPKKTTEEKKKTTYSFKSKNIDEEINISDTSGKKRKIKDLDESTNSSRSLSTTYSSDEEIKDSKSPTKEELAKLLEDANKKIAKMQSLEVKSLPYNNTNTESKKRQLVDVDDETIAYNNTNTESQKRQHVDVDDETASVASENEGKQELIKDHPIQSPSNFSDHEVQNYYYNDEQLFGPDWVNDKAIVTSTLKGQSPRMTKQQNPVQVDCLHGVAKYAIIVFSIMYGQKKGWPKQSVKEIEQAMTQKVGELKRQAAKNKTI